MYGPSFRIVAINAVLVTATSGSSPVQPLPMPYDPGTARAARRCRGRFRRCGNAWRRRAFFGQPLHRSLWSLPEMSHKPPMPEAAVSPYPPHPAPIPAAPPTAEKVPSDNEAPSSRSVSGRTVGIAAGAAAIGSAAIAAAVIFYNRSSSAASGDVVKAGPARKRSAAADKSPKRSGTKR
jgi:hypothetical protein